jgi:hypothetical protein
MPMLGIPIPGCSLVSGRLLAFGGGGAKVIGAACGPLRFQLGVGVEALAAVEQESGEGVDGHAAAEDFADDLAVALRLAVEKVSLALRLLALFGFLQAAAFLGRLHLGGIIDGSACHRTSPVAGGQNLSGGEASGEKYFANRRKIFCC